MSSVGAAGENGARRMLVLTDEQGRVVAAAHVGRAREDDLAVGIRPLPGQRVHEVEVPAAVASLEHGHHLEMFFAAARLGPDGRLSLPEIEIVQGRQRRAE
jgi:hypothetical protein